jgi:diguanylate cyclase (GGDEF)-like protein
MIGPVEPSALRSVELFSSLLDDDLAYIASRSALAAYQEGRAVFGPGAKADRLYVVFEGEVSVLRGQEGRPPSEIARFLPGEAMGDFDFAVGRRHTDLALAGPGCLLIEFPAGGIPLAELAREKPDTVARLMLKSLVMVSSRLRSAHQLIRENAPWIRELRRQVYTDPSTGLWSRAFLEEEIPAHLERPSAVITLKPDRFKALVDGRGHAAGDAAMVRLAARLKEAEGRGWALRLASNQTALVMPGIDSDEALALARALSASLDIDPDLPPLGFSCAYGLWPDDCADFKELMDRCERIMLRIWKEGGGRIERTPGTGAKVSGGRR